MPPYNSDDEQEAELDTSEMMPVVEDVVAFPDDEDDDDDDSTEEEEDDEDENDEGRVDDEDDEDDDDEEDTDSENEPEVIQAKVAPPRMRIKLKLPRAKPASVTTAASSSGTTEGVTDPAEQTSSDNPADNGKSASSDDVVMSVGGSRPKPNLPLKRLPVVGLLKKPTGDTSSLGGSSSGKAKSRMRSLKLPFSKKPKEEEEEEEEVVTAEIVSSGKVTPTGGTYTKRRSMHPSKPIKLPPVVSPGLIVQQSSGKKVTSSQLFDEAMQTAGYTDMGREERPHRGSSVKRTVDDLFDSNVKLTMHFPELVPPDIWDNKKKDGDGDVVMGDGGNGVRQYGAQDLMEDLRQVAASDYKSKLKKFSFEDMLPISLTAALPESYIQERLSYVRAVEEREKSIVTKQAAEEEAEFNGGEPPAEKVPPIPTPPEPPRLEPMDSTVSFVDNHPLYPPKRASLVAHLDPNAFHITNGRYFGLFSNRVVDPNFCGPNALGTTAGSALATAGASSTSAPLTLSTFLFSTHPISAFASTSNANSGPTPVNANHASPSVNEAVLETRNPTPDGAVTSSSDDMKKDSPTPVASEKSSGNTPFASITKEKKRNPQTGTFSSGSSGLKKVMEEGGAAAEEMRQTIIQAAVYASRTGGHGQTFVTATGEVYPDIGKAFAAFAGIKPCGKCKSNKQGSYHCRLRRKHTDPDFDGGKSSEVLRDLQNKPLESIAPATSNSTSME